MHHLTSKAMKQQIATPNPIFPTVLATTVSFSCNGVSSSPASPTNCMVLPHSECRPTATRRMVPLPSETCVPDRIQQSSDPDSSTRFLIGSDSPVKDASSTTRPWLITTMPSAVTLSPVSKISKSPTTSEVWGTSLGFPPLITFTWIMSRCAFSFRNCRSFW